MTFDIVSTSPLRNTVAESTLIFRAYVSTWYFRGNWEVACSCHTHPFHCKKQVLLADRQHPRHFSRHFLYNRLLWVHFFLRALTWMARL